MCKRLPGLYAQTVAHLSDDVSAFFSTRRNSSHRHLRSASTHLQQQQQQQLTTWNVGLATVKVDGHRAAAMVAWGGGSRIGAVTPVERSENGLFGVVSATRQLSIDYSQADSRPVRSASALRLS
jgi:hypothetical protein